MIEFMKEKEIKKEKNKNWTKWMVAGLVILALMTGTRVLKNQRVVADRRYLMEKQKELMMGMWAEDGLTEEEMEERMHIMIEKRAEFGGDEDRNDMGVMRMRRLVH